MGKAFRIARGYNRSAMRMARRFCALPRGVAAVAAAFLLALVVAEAPHTVHHLFDGGGEASQECAFASTADHSQAATTQAGLAAPIQVVERSVGLPPSPPRLCRTLGASPARAPPTSTV